MPHWKNKTKWIWSDFPPNESLVMWQTEALPCVFLLFSHSVVSDSFRTHGPPVLSVCGISQARILEWVPISFSRESSWPSDWTQVSCIVGRLLTDSATDSLGVPGKHLNHYNYVYQGKSEKKEKGEVIQHGVWCRFLLVTALTSFLGVSELAS